MSLPAGSEAAPLRRVLGPVTTLLVGLGVAIGSGIFRTPGDVAAGLGRAELIYLVWIAGGAFVFVQGLVSAELSSRFPQAGGEYVFLREAYGPSVAFFFGWGYTIFIVGGGAATIAAAAGEASVQLLGWPMAQAGLLGVGWLAAVAAVNALGVVLGAGLQNVLTAIKIGSLLLVVGFAFTLDPAPAAAAAPEVSVGAVALVAAFIPVLWAYEGTTDAVKLAEEVKDVQRALPRALLGSAVLLTILYVGVNYACVRVLGVGGMAESKFVASDLFHRLFGPAGRRAMTALSLLVFLGSLSSTVLATVRVTFALARDGWAPRRLGVMSSKQAPVYALALVTLIAAFFTFYRSFDEILGIYFLAAAILFGLSYASLLVFRRRDRSANPPPQASFKAPGGAVLAVGLILVQLAMAVGIVRERPADSLRTGAFFVGLMLIYMIVARRRTRAGS